MSPDPDPIVLALAALTSDQLTFLQSLPKAELHAHLNGSIPLPSLQALARSHPIAVSKEGLPPEVSKGIEILTKGFHLDSIYDFFGLFPAIYALTSNEEALAGVTRDVLNHFLAPDSKTGYIQCQYMELRTTPRKTPSMTRRQYLEAVLGEVEKWSREQTALIVSLDRRMSLEDVDEVVNLAIALKDDGRRVVGIDLCGDPLVCLGFCCQYFC